MDDAITLDFHVHAGMERRGLPLSAFVESLAARGVRVAGFVDHAECYYASTFYDGFQQYFDSLERDGFTSYPRQPDALPVFFADVQSAAAQAPIKILRGLEIAGVDDVPDPFLDLPDYFLNCSTNLHREAGDTYGARAAARIRRFGRRIAPTRKPGIIAHPFRELYAARTKSADGGRSAPKEWLTPDDARRMAHAAAEYGLFLEVNEGCLRNVPPGSPVADLAVHAVGLLLAQGAALSVGSDSHSPPTPAYAPAFLRVVTACGLTDATFAAARRALVGPHRLEP